MWEAVRSLVAAGTDVLLTTHYLDEADELADHVVVIDHGTAIASGTVAELKASVGRDVIEVTVADPLQLEPRRRAAGSSHRRTPRASTGSGRRASASATNGTRQLAAVVALLDDADIAVDEIGLRRPTLDEVFLTLTRDNNPAPVPIGAPNDRSAA